MNKLFYSFLSPMIMALVLSSVFLPSAALIYGPDQVYNAVSVDDLPTSLHRNDEAVTFTKVTLQAGLEGVNSNHFAWGDYNNDGFQDLLMGSRLYRNNGFPGYNFTDVTSSQNISGGGNGVWADYNNDGFLDFYTTGDRLWKNTGFPDHSFIDVTISAGNLTDEYPSMAAGWGDYDRDGDVDLYVANGEHYNDGNTIFYPDIFYDNNGDGTFTDRTVTCGLDTQNKLAYGRSVNWGDYNNDGWLDIHVGNYRLCPNYLWRNNGDGTFTDVASITGTTGDYDPDRYFDQEAQNAYGDGTWGPTYGHTIGSAWGDLDNDGNLDLWDSNLVHKYVGPTQWPSMPYDIRGYVCDDSKIYRNNGAPAYNFTDVRPMSGIPFNPIGGSGTYQGDELWSGVTMGDYDNDGDLDVFVPQIYDLNYAYSHLYRNNGAGVFTDMAGSLGLGSHNTYGGSWCDYDNDGDLDLIAGGERPFDSDTIEVHLFRNNGNSNHWLHVKLNGLADNQPGIGSRIKLTTQIGEQIREVEGGMGTHGHQNSILVEFGLGSVTLVDELEVIWPDGTVQLLRDLDVDRVLTIDQPSGAPEIQDINVAPLTINEDESVEFSALAVDPDGTISLYEWDFDGDGDYDWQSVSSATVSHTYWHSGTYFARLRVWDDTGVLGDVERTDFFCVNNVAPVALLVGDTEGMEDSPLHFSASGCEDTPSDILNLSYRFDFGDGNSTGWVDGPDHEHVFTDCGTYTVCLTLRDDDGFESVDLHDVTIHNVVPAPLLSVPQEGWEDELLNFTSICNDSPSDHGKIQYRWTFGDGESTEYSYLNSTSYVYEDAGLYEVTLWVRDRHGAVNSTSTVINISNVVPSCSSLQEISVIQDSSYHFVGSGWDTVSDGEHIQFRWDFGDGFISPWSVSPSMDHTYTRAGRFIAVLETRDDDLDVGMWAINVTVENVIPDLQFDILSSTILEDDNVGFIGVAEDSPSDQGSLEYRMDFGDGNITPWQSSGEFTRGFSASGFYGVTMSVRDNSNATVNETLYLTVENSPPISSFSYTPHNRLVESMEITFDGSSSMDTSSDLYRGLNYTWTMGVEGTYHGQKVIHQFLTSGSHLVELMVRDDDGALGTSETRVTISNVPPVAVINLSSDRVEVGEILYLDASSSLDTPGDMPHLEYVWQIGNIQHNGIELKHIFSKPGLYAIRLSIIDDDGDVHEVTERVMVSEGVPSTDSGNSDSGVLSVYFLWTGGILLMVLFGFAGGFLLFLRSRRRKHSKDIPDGQSEDSLDITEGGPNESSVLPGVEVGDHEVSSGKQDGVKLKRSRKITLRRMHKVLPPPPKDAFPADVLPADVLPEDALPEDASDLGQGDNGTK